MTDGHPARARVAIPCGFAGCEQAAAMVELIPTGAAYADGERDILHALHFSGTLRISGFLHHANCSTPVDDYNSEVATVRGAGDDVAAVLYGLSKDYAPFFCAACGCAYCTPHWKLEPTYAEHHFDYYSGDCPAKHFKVIDH